MTLHFFCFSAIPLAARRTSERIHQDSGATRAPGSDLFFWNPVARAVEGNSFGFIDRREYRIQGWLRSPASDKSLQSVTSRSPSSALSHPFLGRVPLLKHVLQKSGTPILTSQIWRRSVPG